MSSSLPGRAVVFYFNHNAYYLRGLLIVLVVYTLCGASALQSVELQRSIGDAAVRHSTLNLRFDLFKKVCDRTFQYTIA